MSYGSPKWQGWVLEEKESIEHIKLAYAHGINTFDTADVYSQGISEIILGKALKEINVPRESYVVMTKVFFSHTGPENVGVTFSGDKKPEQYGFVNCGGLSRKHIFDSIKGSLKRLQLDYVDVLQCHRFDKETPIEETMHALHDVVKAGHVRYIGMSSCYAWEFHAMQNYAINNGLTPFISMQNHLSLLYREEEREMNTLCKYLGVGTIPWSPLARGLLTRPVDTTNTTVRGKTDQWVGKNIDEASKEIIKRVEELAKKKQVSMAQIAIAWVMKQDTVAAPIIGTTSIDKLKDMIDAVNVELSDEEIKHLGEPYIPRAIFGH